MGADYYGVLKLRKTATEDEIKRAYQKLAMKWHPEVHGEDKETAKDRFKSISIAYEVLRDGEKRRLYDERGDSAVAELEAAGSVRDAKVVFQEVFGFASPLELDADKAASFQEKLEKVFSSALEVTSKPEITCKAPPIECKLLCSLEDLYNGCRKKVKITKTRLDANGKEVPVEEKLTVEVKAGWRGGTKVTFQGKGNEKEGRVASDVVLVIEEKPHAVMKREGDDLVVVMKVGLVDALTGYTAHVETLDGRILMVPCVHVLTPSSEVVVKDEGMPLFFYTPSPSSSHHPLQHTPTTNHGYLCLHNTSTSTNTGSSSSSSSSSSGGSTSTSTEKKKTRPTKGNLRLHFDIVFPPQLSASQKAAIRHALTEMK